MPDAPDEQIIALVVDVHAAALRLQTALRESHRLGRLWQEAEAATNAAHEDYALAKLALDRHLGKGCP